MIYAIAAVDWNWGIGYKNELLFRIPEDMKRFKALTEYNVVIMGQKTFESMGSEPLKNRINMVISYGYSNPVRDKNGVIYLSLEDAISYIRSNKSLKDVVGHDVYVIGGGSIYKQLIKYCDKALITMTAQTFKADTYFPNLDDDPGWECEYFGDVGEYKGIQYQFITFKNIGGFNDKVR